MCSNRDQGFTLLEVMVALAIVAFSLTAVAASMGQMIDDVKIALAGRKSVYFYGRAGGNVPMPEDIVKKVQEIAKEG